MPRTNAQIVRDWTAKLTVRLQLEHAARDRYVWHPTPANLARLQLRKRQVADAQKVIARHQPAGISEAALLFIRQWEGRKLYAYDDATELPWGSGPGHSREGTKTIGTGLTASDFPGGQVPDRITPDRDDQIFRDVLTHVYLPPVLAALKRAGIKPTPGVVTGCVSASYNLGAGAFGGARGFETLTRALQPRRATQAAKRRRLAEALLLYDNPNDPRVHAGLHRRRVAEHDLVLKG